jgi:hypothetical protein
MNADYRNTSAISIAQSAQNRARAYLHSIPPAVSGAGGHAQTFAVACALIHGFALDQESAFQLIFEWNTHCVPHWTERELRHKLKSASNAGHTKQRGHLLGNLKVSTVHRARPSPADVQPEREREQFRALKLRAEKSLRLIAAAHACDVSDLWEMSPYRLDGNAADEGLLLLRLYRPEDVIWIGEKKESARDDHDDAWKLHCATRFRTAADWSKGEPTGHHICPNPFKAGVCSRIAANIVETRFLVVESDTLTKSESCAILKWLSKILWLRAVVDTGGKSLHGWFEYPTSAALKELKAILPALKCDGALFQPAHTCRFPGPMRETGRRQHLTYLDLEGVQ